MGGQKNKMYSFSKLFPKQLNINKQEWIGLSIIFVLAISIRVIGITWGLPSQHHLYSTFWSDELSVLFASLLLGKGGYYNQILQIYPLFYYISFFFFGLYFLWGQFTGLYPDLGAFQAQYMQDISPFLLAGRFFTLTLAALAVIATYFLGRKLFNRRVGWIASIFLLFSFGHVVYSKVFRLDTALPLVFIISLYLIINLLDAPAEKLRPFVLCALGMTLVTGFKVTGWAYLAPLFLIPFLTDPSFSLKRPFHLPKLDKRFVFLLFVFAATYFTLISPVVPQFISSFQRMAGNQLGGGFSNANGLSPYDHSIVWHTIYVLPRQLGIIIYSLVWLGMILLPFYKNNRKQILLFIITLAAYLLPVGYAARTNWRDMMPILPFFVIIAAFALDQILQSFFKWRKQQPKQQIWITAVILAVILIMPIYNIYQQKVFILKTDTRDLAKIWIEENIPAHSNLAIESYGPGVVDEVRTNSIRENIAQRGWPLNPLPEAPMYRMAWLDLELSLGKSNLDTERLLPFLMENEIEYVIVSSGYYGRYYQGAIDNHFPEFGENGRKFHDLIATNLTPVKQFLPLELDVPGPVIQIYSVPEQLSETIQVEPELGSFVPFPDKNQTVTVVGYYQFSPR